MNDTCRPTAEVHWDRMVERKRKNPYTHSLTDASFDVVVLCLVDMY